jgi:DNA-binding response OmpR family regulator
MTRTRGALSSSAHSEPAKAPRPLRIIVADDDRDAVLTLAMVLRDEGHDVRGLYRAEDVLRAIKDFEADAVFLDIAMPGMNGYEAARKINEQYGDRRPLLVAITGVYKQSVDRILSQMVGFDHHLVKPYLPSDIFKLLAPLKYPKE